MVDKVIIGVDMGGTNLSIGIVKNQTVHNHHIVDIDGHASEEVIIRQVIDGIGSLYDNGIHGIGIGVPSLVDVQEGIVYDVQNIPSWEKVHLKEILENHFNVPVYVNNDANCFAAGEKYFGKGRSFKNFVGLTIGTGLGAGLIIGNHLYSGPNCGAGEFGSIKYLDHIYEYYCSGQFFKNSYGVDGKEVYQQALTGHEQALAIFKEFGEHLGHAVSTILFAFDPEAVILGGSISRAYPLFKEGMWETIRTFPFQHTIDRLIIETTEQPNIAVLGAAALYYDAQDINVLELSKDIIES